MIIRRMTGQDWSIARQARLRALEDMQPREFFADALRIARQRSPAQWRSWVSSLALFVAEDDDGKLVGSAAGIPGDDGVAWLGSMWVDPAQRGSRLSDQLVNAVIDWSRAAGYTEVRLRVMSTNQSARDLYRRTGFTETGIREPLSGNPSTVEIEMGAAVVSTRGRTAPIVHLRPLLAQDETAFVVLREALHHSGFDFARDYVPGTPWSQYLDRLEVEQRLGPPGGVPYTFLVAESPEGTLIGSGDIRHRLTDRTTSWGGHIGYAVAPHARNQGIATEILRCTVRLAAEGGISRVRMTCRQDNIASRRVITGNHGHLDTQSEGICRYWIEPNPSV